MNITVPALSLVVLIGPSGSGKSTFASKHFKPTEVLSSDNCRGLVSDDENDQAATKDAFEVLHFIARKRLAAGRLTVVDATNVQVEARKPLVELAREAHVLPVAIVFNLPAKLCRERNRDRPNRDFGPHVVRQHSQQLRRSLRGLRREGFRYTTILNTPDMVDTARIVRQPLWADRRQEHGPFDIIGDVHGCFDELVALLEKLGYNVGGPPGRPTAHHPEGRRAVFVGDLVDRGPNSPGVLRLVMAMVADAAALCVPGNHDIKLVRKLKGRDVQITHGLAETLAQLAGEPDDFKRSVMEFLDGLVSHYVLDDGRLVVAHAGLKQELQGRASGQVREFALYGETTGETDEFGLPVRHNWADDYRGSATVVYGHTPVPAAEWLNRTICIDTGCVFGGKLTALRYPEKELVHVQASRTYYDPVRPLLPPGEEAPSSSRRPHDDLLDINDVLGKRIVTTRIHRNVTIREENALAALEVMSRFAVDPRWLIYLPPTMAPPDTCKDGEYLEHPRAAFAYFREQGVPTVVCEEKHMGSRAIVVLCRDQDAAERRFLADNGRLGLVYTRTGRPFFSDTKVESELLSRMSVALEQVDFWDRFETDWLCLDVELMPWSAKAQGLLRDQYAATAAAASTTLDAAVSLLNKAADREEGSAALLTRYQERQEMASQFREAYRRYCWPVKGVADLKLAPFHLLATEGRTYTDKDHTWHMETVAALCQADGEIFAATPYKTVDLTDPDSETIGISWWKELTSAGGEGIVVKPLQWIVRGSRGLVQPAMKCRGREYLRLIYGPEYTAPEHLERLRARKVSVKRSLALREFALGVEALHRFTEGEPLYRVHECIFGVLALESEPVDPRL